MISLFLSVAVAQTSPIVPLQVWWSSTHNDNAVVATLSSIASLDKSYVYVGDDSILASNTSQPDLIPLNFYSNPTTNHHITTASTAGNAFALANGFIFVRIEGWVWPGATSPCLNCAALEMWYSVERDDHFLVGTAVNRANAVGAGYQLLYNDSFVDASPWTVWPNTPPIDIPFPLSSDLLGFEYEYGAMAVPAGIHADTWYPSHAANDYLYSSWTDGTVNNITSGSGGDKATTGIATIIGNDPFNLTVTNVAVYSESAAPYQGRYPSLNFYYKNVWYYGTYSLENYGAWYSPPPQCGNWCIQGPMCDIRYSYDNGVTWSAPRRNMTSYSDNQFGETAYNNSKVKFGAPHAVDFGKENQYSIDNRLYIIGHGAETPESHQSWMQGDR